MTCKFSGIVWPDHGVYPNLVEPRSTERQKVILLSSFGIQETSHMVGKLSAILLLNSSCNFNMFQTYAKLA